MTDDERGREMKRREMARRPMHSPRHYDSGRRVYLVTAACYEHQSHIGFSDAIHSPQSGEAPLPHQVDGLQVVGSA